MAAGKDILKEADKALYDIGKKISFLAVNPKNESREKKKFFSGRAYEPQFRYEPYRTNIDRMIKKLQAIKTNRSYMGQILEQKKQKHMNRFLMLRSRGDSSFTGYSLKLYGRPNKMVVRKAKRLLYSEPEKKSEKLTPREVMEILREALKVYGFSWEVKQKLMSAEAAVQQSKKRVLIKKGKKFSLAFMKRLIAHEIGTHVLRVENGLLQPYSIFATGFPGYLETEEGLAVVNEERAGVLSKSTLKMYAGRAVAVSMALDNSFRGIYKHLRDYFPKEQAWRITARAKRGIADTSQPGGLTKDYQYLNGYFKVKNYLKKHNINNLYYGKVSMRHAKMLGKIPDLVKPRYLPK